MASRPVRSPVPDARKGGGLVNDDLPQQVIEACRHKGWSMHWTARGAYLHLEASELIEAVRGKHGDPTAEAADVLIVLMSITQSSGIEWGTVVETARRRVAALKGGAS